jgi:type I restriction enzyme, S subunit
MNAVVPNGYKQTEVGVIPEDWSVVTLACLASTAKNSIVGGPFGSDLVSTDYVSSGVPVVRGQNMGQAFVSGDFVFVSKAKAKSLSANLAREGDLIFTQRGTLGQVSVVPSTPFPEYVVSQSQMKLSLGSELADRQYVFQYFCSTAGQKQILESAIQTGVPHTNLGILKAYKVTLPVNLDEQRAIATALSDVDALLAKIDQLIAKKRDLKQAVMQQLLTGQTRLPGFSGAWEVKTMKSLGQTYGGLAGKTKEDFGHGSSKYIPFMNVMTDTVIDPTWLESVDVAQHEAQNLVKKGDLFFNGSSETPEEVGFCSVLLEDIPSLYLNSFCFGFRFHTDAKVHGLFFAYWFRGADGRAAMSVLAQGATRYNIAKSAFMRLSIPQPSQEEQTAIATILSDMDAELSALEARRDKTRALKQGMMQALLTGRIRLV